MSEQWIDLLLLGTVETLYMTMVSSFFAYLFGIPLGVVLFATSENGLRPNRKINLVIGLIVNTLRSAPFIILLLALIPVTRFVMGTTIGSSAMILPLVVAATPFVGRMVESSLKEVGCGVIEAAQSMGCSNFKIVTKVLLVEAKPALLMGATITVTTILGYSAMAGFVGGGGLGTLAINYGLYRYETNVMIITLVLLIVLVQLFQVVGMRLANKIDKRK